jgi:hypothetical protein
MTKGTATWKKPERQHGKSTATWKKHRNMEKAPQHGKSTATWKKHRNTTKHRKTNAAQEARQCKDKDQRPKTQKQD